jgi:hypothetical protein
VNDFTALYYAQPSMGVVVCPLIVVDYASTPQRLSTCYFVFRWIARYDSAFCSMIFQRYNKLGCVATNSMRFLHYHMDIYREYHADISFNTYVESTIQSLGQDGKG